MAGVVNASIGQATGSREHLKMAQQYFQVRKTKRAYVRHGTAMGQGLNHSRNSWRHRGGVHILHPLDAKAAASDLPRSAPQTPLNITVQSGRRPRSTTVQRVLLHVIIRLKKKPGVDSAIPLLPVDASFGSGAQTGEMQLWRRDCFVFLSEVPRLCPTTYL